MTPAVPRVIVAVPLPVRHFEARLVATGPDEVLVRALRSGISRGTETLVFQGAIGEERS